MNNLMLIISVIIVAILLIGLNFNALYNYSTYVVPMKNAIFDKEIGHYDYVPLNQTEGFGSIETIELLPKDDIRITFGQNNYVLSTEYKPIPDFTYSHIFSLNDTFVSICFNMINDKSEETYPELSEPFLPGLSVVKYLGQMEIDNEIQWVFWHESAALQKYMPCDYPQVIENSINLWDN